MMPSGARRAAHANQYSGAVLLSDTSAKRREEDASIARYRDAISLDLLTSKCWQPAQFDVSCRASHLFWHLLLDRGCCLPAARGFFFAHDAIKRYSPRQSAPPDYAAARAIRPRGTRYRHTLAAYYSTTASPPMALVIFRLSMLLRKWQKQHNAVGGFITLLFTSRQSAALAYNFAFEVRRRFGAAARFTLLICTTTSVVIASKRASFIATYFSLDRVAQRTMMRFDFAMPPPVSL